MATRSRSTTYLFLASLLVPAACDVASSSLDDFNDDPASGGSTSLAATLDNPRKLGEPIPGLTAEQLAAFHRGRDMFEKVFKPSDGLGPFYNATSCRSCHSVPITGGSAQLYRNFFIAAWGTLSVQGAIPPFLSPIVPAFGEGDNHATTTQFTLEGGRNCIPTTFNGFEVFVAQRNAPPIFGVGLFEFISDATILSNEDPFDTDADGISGRHNLDAGAIGRFGYKSQSNNIEVFTRAPLQNQLGITTNPFQGAGAVVHMLRAPMLQASGDPTAPTIDHDPIPDPEFGHEDLGDLIAFTRFLGPPHPLPFDAAALNGEALFDQIGCTKCHIPELPSSRGPVRAYTDLLVHYMGEELADRLRFGGSGSTALEFRTQPLWGVSLHGPFLHDGRAETLEEAILMHGGEALTIRNAYSNLTPAERADIIRFLEHL